FLCRGLPPSALDTLSLHDALPILPSARGDRKSLLHGRGRQIVLRGMKFHAYRLGCPVHIAIAGCADIIDIFRPFVLFFLRRRLLDRKSTRLNSSHVSISYAVFCLK